MNPGGNPDRIELAFSEPVHLDGGDLVVAGLRQHKPKVLQDGVEITTDYFLNSSGHVNLAIAHYDRSRELTVDPILEFASYIGGPGSDGVSAIVLDKNGFILPGRLLTVPRDSKPESISANQRRLRRTLHCQTQR